MSEGGDSWTRVASLLFFSAAFVLSGCGGGPANVLDPPSFISGARPAPGTSTYEPVTGDTDAGEYAFPWDLYENGPECREPDPPTTCPPLRIGIEDIPVAFTHPAFHGRVVLDGATFAYWRPLASEATQGAFAACTEAEPCRVFYIDSGGDPALREGRARAVLEHMGLPAGDGRWFIYDRAQGARGWYELPGFEDFSHGTDVALAALGRSFHPFPFPDPVIVPMARILGRYEALEEQHYFSDLVAEMRRDPEGLEQIDRRYRDTLGARHDAADIINGSDGLGADINSVRGRDLLRTWREDHELIRDRSPLTRAEYVYAGAEFDSEVTVEVVPGHEPEEGFAVVRRGCGGEGGGLCLVWDGATLVQGSAADEQEEQARARAGERFRYLYGAGRVDVDANDPDGPDDRAGAFAPASTPRISLQEGGRSAPVASTRLRVPAAYGALGERLSGLSAVGFDAIDFPYRYSLSDLVSEPVEPDSAIPEFLTDAAGVAAACHPLIRLSPGLGCWPWTADASIHALVSPDGTGAAWRFSEDVALSAFTRHRGRLDGVASGAFSFEGGSSLAALRFDRTWPLDETGRWRMGGTFTLAADLPRGFGARRASMFEAGPALLSDWSFRVTHAWRDAHTHLSLSQAPRAETGHARLVLPSGRLEDGTRLYETHRFSLVPSRRELMLRLAHQRPFLGGDMVFSALRTANPGHTRASARHLAGIAWRRSF